jgi:hypothetical protein
MILRNLETKKRSLRQARPGVMNSGIHRDMFFGALIDQINPYHKLLPSGRPSRITAEIKLGVPNTDRRGKAVDVERHSVVH